MIAFSYKKSIWGVNDDFVLNQIITSDGPLKNSLVSFMSYPLGYLLALFYKLTNFEYIYGIFIHFANLISLIVILKIISKYKNTWIVFISFFIVFISTPILILNPTYTITSILATFSGLFLFLFLMNNKTIHNKLYLLVAGILVALGISIRIDTYKGFILFFGIYLSFYLYLKRKNISIFKLTYFSTPSFLVLFFQFVIQYSLFKSNTSISEYLNFQNYRHNLFYTPALLIMHQQIIANNLLVNIWGNVEMILFRNWFYPDSSIYNSLNLKTATESVNGYMGINGLLNSDLFTTFSIMKGYLNEVNSIFFIALFLLIVCLLLSKFSKLFISLSLALIFGYLISFYYASAVLRLPIRVTFPFLIIFCLTTLFNLEIVNRKNKLYILNFQKILFSFVLLLLIAFNVSNKFGFKLILEDNSENLNWAISRDIELNQFDSKAIYIAPTAFVPASFTGPFLTDKDFTSLQKTIATDWSTFSPSWKLKAKELKLNPENLFKSLAKTQNVYLISDEDLSSVIDMYMNDNNILRGKKCAVFNLTGSDSAKIYTFQAKEDQC